MSIKFVGEHIAKLDDKGRLVFPSPLKSLAESEGVGRLRFVVRKNIFCKCLDVFTYDEWVRESESVKSRLNLFNREHATFWREYMRNRAMVEPDEKMGRIQIPKHLLEMIDVCKEVVFAGNDHKVEIWSKEHYQSVKLSESEFVHLAEKILS